LTYIIDLQRLWESSASVTPEQQQAAAKVYLDPRKNLVSAVVVAHKDEDLLLQTLHSVLAQQFLREVIIVNGEGSASIDKALTKLAAHYPKCYLVNGQKNTGLAAAFNLGARYASGQYLLFLSGNGLLAKNAILHLLTTGIRKPTPWVIGTGEQLSCSAQVSAFSQIKKILLKEDSLKYEHSQMKSFPEVSLAGGGFHASQIAPECLFIPTQTYLDLSGLDKRCYHSTFHTDLCLRIHIAGGGVYRARDAIIVTRLGKPEAFAEHFRKEWQAFRGQVHFHQKHYGKLTNKFWLAVVYASKACRFIGRLVMARFSKKKVSTSKEIILSKQAGFN
jgi:GT2 family glycosyltransferase